jgi:hypothetical protein
MKRLFLPAVLIFTGLLLAGCGSPPPLVSDRYLNDSSLITGNPCSAPCFQDITVGKTTFADALTLIRNNALFRMCRAKIIRRKPLGTLRTASSAAR